MVKLSLQPRFAGSTLRSDKLQGIASAPLYFADKTELYNDLNSSCAVSSGHLALQAAGNSNLKYIRDLKIVALINHEGLNRLNML